MDAVTFVRIHSRGSRIAVRSQRKSIGTSSAKAMSGVADALAQPNFVQIGMLGRNAESSDHGMRLGHSAKGPCNNWTAHLDIAWPSQQMVLYTSPMFIHIMHSRGGLRILAKVYVKSARSAGKGRVTCKNSKKASAN